LSPSFSLLHISNRRIGIKTYGDHPFVSIGDDSVAKKLTIIKVSLNISYAGMTSFLYIFPKRDQYFDPLVSTGRIDEPTPLFRMEILKNGFVH